MLVLPRSTSPAHPRSRGENGALLSGIKREPGSSPLTRGKRMCPSWITTRAGLIPAHAGKTPPRRTRLRSGTAHPRSRGENPSAQANGSVLSGSSPLTRGKHWYRLDQHRSLRLIPAHAGKTASSVLHLGEYWAHPRSRGENDLNGVEVAALAGSSPLTRGKLLWGVRGQHGVGLIPAHAGKTP